MRTDIYKEVKGYASFEPWIERILHFPEEVIDKALREIPREWLGDGEMEELEKMLERLMKRRTKVPDLIRDLKRGRSDPFPLWQ